MSANFAEDIVYLQQTVRRIKLRILQAVSSQNCELVVLTDLSYCVKLWYLKPPLRDVGCMAVFQFIKSLSSEWLMTRRILRQCCRFLSYSYILPWQVLSACLGIRVAGQAELYNTWYGQSIQGRTTHHLMCYLVHTNLNLDFSRVL